jgi:hypothetical protein
MRNFSGHANAFTQRGMWVDGFANVHSISTHLNGQSNFTNHVAGMRAHHTAAQDFAVTVGLG